eukprot:jgi/Mesvir1/13095/Mv06075-RA.1
MDLVASLREYCHKILKDIRGMKMLIVDRETVAIVSTVYSQSEILKMEVFLVERIDIENESTRPPEAAAGEMESSTCHHMKAVFFVRPTPDNINLIKKYLRSARFKEFHIFFTNIARESYLRELADCDEHELVKQVQEYYADFIAEDKFHFTLNVESNHVCMAPVKWNPMIFPKVSERVVQGILSVLLALKKQPVIRYQRNSEIAKRLAYSVYSTVYEEEVSLFSFWRGASPPLLLILDRRDDPVTPLLAQWTYQAMVHELLGINNNRVSLKHVESLPKDQQEVVLSAHQDPFFLANMFENYGDLGASIKAMVDDFQVKSKSNQNIQTIEDMMRFVENYPQFKSASGAVAKHVTIMSEISRIVEQRRLLEVSQMEQELACNSGLNSAFEGVLGLIENPRVHEEDKVRLVLLFALRYEKEGTRQLGDLIQRMVELGVSKDKGHLIYAILRHAGWEQRTGDLFGTNNIINRVTRGVTRGLKGVDNVYTQHQPLLLETIDAVVKSRLKEFEYPYVGQVYSKERPQDIIIFMVGGTTYEEARAVALLNAASQGTTPGASTSSLRVVLGGTNILNSGRFLSDWEQVRRKEQSLQ